MPKTIYRLNPKATELVELPDDAIECPTCKGKGYQTKYDQGWRSLTYSPALDAPEPCFMCGGKGYLEPGDWAYEQQQEAPNR